VKLVAELEYERSPDSQLIPIPRVAGPEHGSGRHAIPPDLSGERRSGDAGDENESQHDS
jgi:hypothetical protein